MVAAKEKTRAAGAEVTRTYARSDFGREIIRREIVEGAQIQAGDQALSLWETLIADGIEEIVRVAAEIVRELGSVLRNQRAEVEAGHDERGSVTPSF